MDEQLSSYLIKIVNIYERGGFNIWVIFMDTKFEKVSHDLELFQVNTTTDREHVGEINSGIRVIKEQQRSVI